MSGVIFRLQSAMTEHDTRLEDRWTTRGWMRFVDLLPLLVGNAMRFLRRPTVLYEEKVNYKHPGGAGFAPHHDAMAYRFAQNHVMVVYERRCIFVACWGRSDSI